jgi:hypothetical protein
MLEKAGPTHDGDRPKLSALSCECLVNSVSIIHDV